MQFYWRDLSSSHDPIVVVLLPVQFFTQRSAKNFLFPFYKSKIEEVFAMDWEEVRATSMAVNYNHNLVIGSFHTERTVHVWSALHVPHVWKRLSNTHVEG